MNTTIQQHQEQQEVKRQQGKISSFIGNFQAGTLLNKSGVVKLRGVSPLALFPLFSCYLLQGNNFYSGIITNAALPFKKNRA
ncbi:MAG: hypothetical protein Q7U64_03680 [Desulfocapsaceae bacterium]|nr:hypothetical protein [Desulfocapsaceae bacterium]